MKAKEFLEILQEDIGNIEISPEQEKQIKNLLGIVELKKWKPLSMERYYYVNDTGGVSMSTWNNFNSMCKFRYETCNVFKTKEEAEFHLEQIKVYNELKIFADEYNEKIDWRKFSENKHCIYFDYGVDTIDITSYGSIQFQGPIYFASQILAQQAVEKVGADRIKKYLFEVKDE